MKSPIPYFRDFPKDFQKEIVDKVISVAESAKNLQFVGLKGSGKSLTFRYLLENSEIQKRFNVFQIDFNLVPEKTMSAVSSLVLQKLSQWEAKIDEFDKKTIILADTFENVVDIVDVKVFNGISDRYRDYLSFIFSMERPICDGNVYWGEMIYTRPLVKKDFDWFWKGLGGDTKYKEKIYKSSGGYMALIKRLFEIFNSGGNLEEAINNPRVNPHLLYQLELMKEGLRESNNYFDVPIFNTFMNGLSTKSELTSLENKAFQFLVNNKEMVVERDTLIKVVWGEHASNDVADHALDQVIHRLKQKIEKDGYKLETIRGRGHRLEKVA